METTRAIQHQAMIYACSYLIHPFPAVIIDIFIPLGQKIIG
jgi:hypothetical protein